MKNELNTCFQQKFATSSYRVGIGRAWCSRKACEICSSLVQKKKLKKIYFSSHKLPKQQSTSFWSQGILGVKKIRLVVHPALEDKRTRHRNSTVAYNIAGPCIFVDKSRIQVILYSHCAFKTT
jgi:hypothetical protein